jgi:hypothetical protein
VRHWLCAAGSVAALLAAAMALLSPGAANLASSGAPQPLLRQVARLDLPGPVGKRFDYLSIDPQHKLLLISHLAASRVYVLSLSNYKVLSVIEDLPGVEAVEPAPDKLKAYASAWWENKIAVLDLERMAVIKKLPTADKPDGLAYAADFHKMYVSDERGKAEAVVDVERDQIVTTLHFNSETGMPQYDPVTRKIYLNLQDTNTLAVIDPGNDRVIARYPVEQCQGNHGMALDPARHRAFLACEGNDTLAVFDLDKHKTIAALPMAKGADVVKFDPGLARIYVACSSGAVSIFQQNTSDQYRKLQDFPVQKKVHSLGVEPETHRVFVPEEQEDGKPVARVVVYEAVFSSAR